MLLATKYIDENGEIVPVLKKITHNIVDKSQQKMLGEIVDKFNYNILILRGQSDFGKLRTEASILETEKYLLNIKNQGFSYYQLPEPAIGSPNECITNNLNLITQIECQKLQSYFENIRINLIPLDVTLDEHTLYFNEVRSNGIVTHLYNIKFTFRDDWSATCLTCANGLDHVKLELTKLGNYLYTAENSEYDLEGVVISDLNVANIDVLKEKLMLILSNSFNEAKIVDISLTQIINRGENGDEEQFRS